MKKMLAAAVLTIADFLILTRYSIDPNSSDLSSALLGGTGIFMLFGLLCIICCEQLGAFTGPVMRGGYVSHETPAGFFVFFGFLLLLIPVLLIGYRLALVSHGPPIPLPNIQ